MADNASLREFDHDCLAFERYLISRTEFPALPGLDLAVDLHATFSDGLLGGSAAFGKSAEFQKLTEIDRHRADSDCSRSGGGIFRHGEKVGRGLSAVELSMVKLRR